MNQDLKSRVEKLFNQFEALRKSGKDILPLDEEFLSIVKELTTREEKLFTLLEDVLGTVARCHDCVNLSGSEELLTDLKELGLGDDDGE